MVVDLPIPDSSESSTFKLLCDDFFQSRYQQIDEKLGKFATRVADSLTKTKLKHSCDFKELSYWHSSGVSHPLTHFSDVIGRTSSTSPVYKWIRPQQTFVSTSRIQAMTTTQSKTVDVFVKIPDEIFGKRDFINVVYPTKRAHFMCSCAVALKAALPGVEISWIANSTLCDPDFVFPNLLVKESGKKGGVIIHFYASEEGLSKCSRFSPSAANLRPVTVNPSYTGDAEVPSPFYNQRLLFNLLEESLTRRISTEIGGNENIVQALSLIDAWFSARGLSKFNHLFHSVFLMCLLKNDSALEKQSILSVVKGYFSAFVTWLPEDGMGLCEEVDPDLLATHKSVFPAVLFDNTGFLNLAYGLSSDEIAMARSEIVLSLPLLGESSHFDTLFINQRHFYDIFDEYIRLNVSEKEFSAISSSFCVDVVEGNDIRNAFLKNLTKVIHTGMGERCEYIGINFVEKKDKQWPISSDSTVGGAFFVLLGFKITKQWSNPITVGPIANEPSAKEFRAFWHNATTLRKFADTRVCECMVWGNVPDTGIPLKILLFLVIKNYGLDAKSLSWRSKFFNYAMEKEHKDNINSAFSSLSTILRSLKNIPLLITNIHGVSPFLRGTEPHSQQTTSCEWGAVVENHHLPSTHKMPKFTPSVEVFIKMEYSGKWGNDVDAIRKLSAAFYLQIVEQLQKVHSLLAVATENEIFVVKDKIVFKLVIVNDKVHKLLEDRVNSLRDSGAGRIEATPEGKALSQFRKKFVSEMLIQGSLHSFSLKNPYFSASVQLLKLWLASHQLSGVIHDLVIEMIVAAALDTPGVPVPSSTVAAFRRCLRLISTHNWSSRPLVVDFDNAWNEEALAKIEMNFVKMRPVLPPMVVITNEDSVGSKWTRDGPSPLLLKRVIGLASSSLGTIDEGFSQTTTVDLFGSLLQTDFSLYDAVISLNPKIITRTIKVSSPEEPKHLPVVDFDPIADFVKAITNFYGSSAVIFHNKYGGERIGLKFKPNEEEVPAKISRCSLHFSLDRNRLKMNKEEVLEGIELLGKGLVKKIARNF